MAGIEDYIRTDPMDTEVVIQKDRLACFCRSVYASAGMPEGDADLVALLQAETDVRGVHSHGTRALPGYVSRLESGHSNANPNIVVKQEGPSYAILDGDGGLGHLVSHKAMEIAIEKAARTGIAIVTVVNSRHFGAGANYAMMALTHDMIGFCVSSSSPGVAPYGGVDPLLGNNPVAYAIPALKEFPIVLDMACGVSAWGRVGTMQMYGRRLKDDWVLDESGNPTDDPSLAHALLPFGGVKSSGVTIVMDVLASVLPFGLSTVHREGETYHGQRLASQMFYAINISNFVKLETFKTEIDRMIGTIRNSRKKEGVDRIYLPGEVEWLKKEAWDLNGIPLHKDHVAGLTAAGKRFGVAAEW
jgi:LDH2 family malate/lactate/ureidoglycolate dehydrogenase